MWSTDDIEAFESASCCQHCGEDTGEELVSVHVATREWHKVERLCHEGCVDFFVKDNLSAVLASTREGGL